jgi:2'-5' RNA ligase
MAGMHRLFVAIRAPAAVRAQLLAAMGGVSGARWQSEDQLHLTVRFIGEVDRHRAVDVHAALGSVHYAPFELSLAGVGAFDRRGEPTALWAAVAPQEPVKALHRKVDQALARIGLEPEGRAYAPHITLARLPRGAGPVGPFLHAAGRLSSPPFTVGDFCLFESRLTPDGADYTIVERYPLL